MATAVAYRTYIASILNAFPMTTTSAYPTTNASGGMAGFPDAKIDDAVTYAAAEIGKGIAMNAANPLRIAFETPQPVTSGSLLPAHLGPVGGVTINSKPGKATGVDDVQRLITNNLSLTLTDGYYALDGDRIYFTGTPCTVDVVLPGAVTVTTIPDAYFNGVVAIALEFLQVFEGDHTDTAAHWRAIASDVRQSLAAGTLPPVTPPFTVTA